jgi:hypothetical protein
MSVNAQEAFACPVHDLVGFRCVPAHDPFRRVEHKVNQCANGDPAGYLASGVPADTVGHHVAVGA